MRITIATKLMLGFLVVLIPAALILGGFSYYSIRKLIGINKQLEGIASSLEATRELNIAVANLVMPVSEYTINGDIHARDRFGRLLNRVDTKLNTCANSACHFASKEPREMANSIILGVSNVKEVAQGLFGLDNPLRNSHGSNAVNEINNILYFLGTRLDLMSQALIERVHLLETQSHEEGSKALGYLFAFTLAVIAMSTSIGYIISRRISGPIRSLLQGTKHVIEGNLDCHVTVRERDEVGELAYSFNSMIDEIKRYREQLENYSRTLEEKVKQRTEELIRKDEDLRQSEKLASIGLLAGGVAHELNNPLTSILMSVGLLMEDVEVKSDFYVELEKINEDTNRCIRIINELLDFSRHNIPDKTPCDINSLLGESLNMLRHSLNFERMVVSDDFSSNLPLVSCDPGQIQRVFMNIIANAVQAVQGRGVLTLRTSLNGTFIIVSIRDNGPGIPLGLKKKVFDPFFTTKRDGTGLGLSISHRIIHDHGGRIEIHTTTVDEDKGRAGIQVTGTDVKVLIPIEG
ncbi:MAG: ATP-binding protein [Thermodesulfobacteriota bacterium]